jgi:hypothetical protein
MDLQCESPTAKPVGSQIPKTVVPNMSYHQPSDYVPFAYAANNHGAVTLPHWQEELGDASIPRCFIESHGGQRYVPRNLPANFAWRNGKPAQAAECNFGGIVATRPPLAHDNSYDSDAWRWMKPLYAEHVRPAQVCDNVQLRWQYGEQQTRKIK